MGHGRRGRLGPLDPLSSVLQSTEGTTSDASNTVTDAPGLKDPYELTVNVLASRTYPAFRQAVIVAELLPPSLMGDYHLGGTTLTGVRGGEPRAPPSARVPGCRVELHRVLPAADIDGDSVPPLPRQPLRRRLRPADAVTDRWPARVPPAAGRPPTTTPSSQHRHGSEPR